MAKPNFQYEKRQKELEKKKKKEEKLNRKLEKKTAGDATGTANEPEQPEQPGPVPDGESGA